MVVEVEGSDMVGLGNSLNFAMHIPPRKFDSIRATNLGQSFSSRITHRSMSDQLKEIQHSLLTDSKSYTPEQRKDSSLQAFLVWTSRLCNITP